MQYIVPVNPFPMFNCLINLFPWLPRKTYNGKIDHSEKNRNHFVRPRKWACPWAWNVSFYSWIMISIRLGSYDSETLEVIYDEQMVVNPKNRDYCNVRRMYKTEQNPRVAEEHFNHRPKRYHCRAFLVWRLKVQPFALKWGTCSVCLVIYQIYYKRREVTRMFGSSSP